MPDALHCSYRVVVDPCIRGNMPLVVSTILVGAACCPADAKARLVAAAQAMAAAVFPDPAGQLEGPLAALELSTVAARRAEVGVLAGAATRPWTW